MSFVKLIPSILIEGLPMSNFPEQLPHDDIQEIMPHIFQVRGQIKFNSTPPAEFSRNMYIVREAGALTLINTLRLDAESLKKLDALGDVKHVIKLGDFHGRDDAFYLNRYDAQFWAIPGMTFTRGEQISRPLVGGQHGPINESTAFIFDTPDFIEAALYLNQHGGILFTCDSLQTTREPDKYFNEATKKFRESVDTSLPAFIGPGFWSRGKPKLKDMERLTSFEFQHLFSAHGPVLLNTAQKEVKSAVNRVFKPKS